MESIYEYGSRRGFWRVHDLFNKKKIPLTIFGVGMSLAGGCASGTLWRAGEGHIKLWVALGVFALSGSYFRDWLATSGWSAKLGEALFLPDLIGWKLGVISVCLLMMVWYLIVAWNEATKKLIIV